MKDSAAYISSYRRRSWSFLGAYARRFGVPQPIIGNAMELVNNSSLQASEYLKRIKRETDDAESLRRALEEERVAVAEKFASLDKLAAKKEQERQVRFEQTLQRTIAEFEKRSNELASRIQDRTERLRTEREVQRQASAMKREAQRVAKASGESAPGTMTKDSAAKEVRSFAMVDC